MAYQWKHRKRFGRIQRSNRTKLKGLETLEIRRALDADGLAPDVSGVAEIDPPAVIAVPIDIDGIGDGLPLPPDRSSTIETQLDDQGRPTLVTQEVDKDGDGVPEYRDVTSYTYDQVPGETLTETSQDYGADGTIDYRSSYRVQVNAAGQVTFAVNEVDFNGDGTIDQRDTVSYGYDESGNYLSSKVSIDEGADGDIESSSSSVWTYDSEGRLLSTVDSYDSDGDGAANSQSSAVYAYGDGGVLLSIDYNSDHDGDGASNYRSLETYQYDEAGKLATVTQQLDYDGDGVFDETLQHDVSDVVIVDLPPDVVTDPGDGTVKGDGGIIVDETGEDRGSESPDVIFTAVGSKPGDINGDGHFNSSDLVKLFQGGKYEDGENGNADSSSGDFDGDGDFTSSDLILLFAAGGYEGDVDGATLADIAAAQLVRK